MRPPLRVRPPVLYAIAFVLMVGAGVALVASFRGLLQSTRLLWFSMALSVAAVAVAVICVVWPARER